MIELDISGSALYMLNAEVYSFTNLIKNFIKILINYPGKLITENNNLAFYISIFVNLFLVIFSISIIFIKKIKLLVIIYHES